MGSCVGDDRSPEIFHDCRWTVIVDPTWSVAPGLDSGVFSTIIRDDGTEQLMAGRFPLYRFSGDARPGDVTGQGSGDVWFVVGLDAAPITDTATPASSEVAPSPTSEPATTTGASEACVGRVTPLLPACVVAVVVVVGGVVLWVLGMLASPRPAGVDGPIALVPSRTS